MIPLSSLKWFFVALIKDTEHMTINFFLTISKLKTIRRYKIRWLNLNISVKYDYTKKSSKNDKKWKNYTHYEN